MRSGRGGSVVCEGSVGGERRSVGLAQAFHSVFHWICHSGQVKCHLYNQSKLPLASYLTKPFPAVEQRLLVEWSI